MKKNETKQNHEKEKKKKCYVTKNFRMLKTRIKKFTETHQICQRIA